MTWSSAVPFDGLILDNSNFEQAVVGAPTRTASIGRRLAVIRGQAQARVARFRSNDADIRRLSRNTNGSKKITAPVFAAPLINTSELSKTADRLGRLF